VLPVIKCCEAVRLVNHILSLLLFSCIIPLFGLVLLPICALKYRFLSRLIESLQMFSLKGHVRKVYSFFMIFPSVGK
jgi:hypothetical protein